jgi:capsular polysaccharide biosynthesis protein
MADIPVTYTIGLEDVQKFKDFGTYENNIDDFGNVQLILSSLQDSSAKTHYVDFKLKTIVYDETKIIDNNNIQFSELQTEENENVQNTADIINQYNTLVAENRILNDTINEFVEKYENSDDKTVINSMKSEIINLRIQLGQGDSVSDFGDDFPFLPIK